MKSTLLGPAALSDQKMTTKGGQLLRPGRALIGWLQPDQAHQLFAANQANAQPDASYVEAASAAREKVRARAVGLDQSGVIAPPPAELIPYIEQLQKSPACLPYFIEGWQVQLVDLTRVIAVQPVVFTDCGLERIEHARADNMPDLAGITLPLPSEETLLTPLFDKTKNVWTVVSPNPNLRVIGQFAGPIQGAATPVPGLGFFVGILPSFMQVARFQGRYLLRDGNHRALALIAKGITTVPAFVREVESVDGLFPSGLLPSGVWLGDRPPVVTDYLDDQVASTVHLPLTRKGLVIQATEIVFTG